MSLKRFVTARSLIDDSQIFIETKTPKEALNVAGKLHRIELAEHTYTSVSLRASKPSLKKYIDMTSMFLEGA